MGLVGGGAHAEYLVVHEAEALRLPAKLDFIQGASIPEAFFTAYDALVTRARMARGERVLIHAVGSGIGTAAVQIVRLLGGIAIGTSRTHDKLERARGLGLEIGIVTGKGVDIGADLRSASIDPVDVIVDVLGAGALADNLALLSTRGRMVVLAFLQGSEINADLMPLLRKRLEIIGSVMRTRSQEERIELAAAFRRALLPRFSSGELKPV